ncbi:MAG: hypothetical protein CMH54_01600 [Myxococcales bacterium]|nr:hypothetical protein [Myxococcales bacterium]|tara:strand:- start:314 stop:742 length:429 start_codon:yes stop_codon:yes gene_type:complete
MTAVKESIVIDASPERVYEVITLFDEYPDFLPEVEAVESQSLGDDNWQVKQTIRVVKKLTYELALTGVPHKELRWHLTSKGGMLKTNTGSWELEELSDGRTRAEYTLDIVVRGFVPASLQSSLTAASLPAMLKRFKQRVEEH